MLIHLQWEVKSYSNNFRLEDLMNQNENRPVLSTTDVTANLGLEPTPLTNTELQQDFDYFMAQKTAKAMISSGLISLSEINKLTCINRDTFSPICVEIMAEIR